MNNSCSDSSSVSCSFLDDKSVTLNDITQQSINCGESRPTYRSRKLSKAKTPSKCKLRERSGKDMGGSKTPSKGTGDRFIPDLAILGKN